MVATPLFYLKKNYSFVRHPRRDPVVTDGDSAGDLFKSQANLIK